MDTKAINFIIQHFGCYTTLKKERVLTSLGSMSIVPTDEFWKVFSGDAEDFFTIKESENKGELVLNLNESIREDLEKALCITH